MNFIKAARHAQRKARAAGQPATVYNNHPGEHAPGKSAYLYTTDPASIPEHAAVIITMQPDAPTRRARKRRR